MVFYTQHEGWSGGETIYFLIILMTTIGYGDHSAILGHTSKLFTTAMVLFGVGIVLQAIKLTIDQISKADAELNSKKQRALLAKMLDIQDKIDVQRYKSNDSTLTLHHYDGRSPQVQLPHERHAENLFSTRTQRKHCCNRSIFNRPIFTYLKKYAAIIYVFLTILIGVSVSVTLEPEWDWIDGIYFVVVTGTTVGFGDLHPSNDESRAFLTVYSIMVVTAFGIIAGLLSNAYLPSNDFLARINKDAELAGRLPYQAAAQNIMNNLVVDSNGEVSAAQYLGEVLIELEFVDRDLVRLIMAHFNNVAGSGDGVLTHHDLVTSQYGGETDEAKQYNDIFHDNTSIMSYDEEAMARINAEKEAKARETLALLNQKYSIHKKLRAWKRASTWESNKAAAGPIHSCESKTGISKSEIISSAASVWRRNTIKTKGLNTKNTRKSRIVPTKVKVRENLSSDFAAKSNANSKLYPAVKSSDVVATKSVDNSVSQT